LTLDLEKHLRLVKRVEQERRDHDRAAGAVLQLLKQLDADFGVSTVDKGEELLAQMNTDHARDEADYRDELARVEEELTKGEQQ
jgi:hypothetical protein